MAYLTPVMRDLLTLAPQVGAAFHWSVSGVYTEAECEALRARIDAANPTLAPVTTASGPVVRTDIRTNERVMFDDEALAADLLGRLRPHLPDALGGRVLAGLNMQASRRRAACLWQPTEGRAS